MLDSFRRLAGSIWAKILILFLIASFGAWGIGSSLRSLGSNPEVARVGSSAITQEEYAQALQQEKEGLKRLLGDNYSPELLQQLDLPRHVLQKLVTTKLLTQESERLGLIPGDSDVVRTIRNNPAFQDDKGNFDKSRFEAMLKNLRIQEKTYVDSLRQELANQLLLQTVSGVPPSTDFIALQRYDAREEQRRADLYLLEPSLVPLPAAPDEATLAAYYKEHASAFNAPEYRTLSYVMLNNTTLPQAPLDEESLRKTYQEHLDEFKKPEQRSVEQLLFNSEDSVRAAYGQLKAGTPFEQVAKEPDVLNKNAVSLGDITRDQAVDGSGDAIFSTPAGSVAAPVKTEFGWHIFRVTAIKAAAVAPFDAVRPQLEKEARQHGSDDALYQQANKLEDALAGGSSLAEAAKELGLSVVALPPVDAAGKTSVGTAPPQLPEDEKFLTTAFKTEEKTESPLVTAKAGGYYLLRVDSVTPARARPLAEVRDQAVANWQDAAREKRLGELAQVIAQKFINPATRQAVIGQYHLRAAPSGAIRRGSLTADDALSLPPALTGEIFARNVGEASAAYAQLASTHTRKNGYILAVITAINPAAPPNSDPKLAQALAALRKELDTSMENELAEQYIANLRTQYPIRITGGITQETP